MFIQVTHRTRALTPHFVSIPAPLPFPAAILSLLLVS